MYLKKYIYLEDKKKNMLRKIFMFDIVPYFNRKHAAWVIEYIIAYTLHVCKPSLFTCERWKIGYWGKESVSKVKIIQ